MSLVLTAGSASADLGRPVIDARADGVRVVVYAAPVPLRTGPSEWTVFVLDAVGGQRVDGASVRLHLHPPAASEGDVGHHHGGMIDVQLHGTDAKVAASLGSPGDWEASVSVDLPDGRNFELEERLSVEPARQLGGAAVWAFAIPYAVIGAFLASQRAAARRRNREPA